MFDAAGGRGLRGAVAVDAGGGAEGRAFFDDDYAALELLQTLNVTDRVEWTPSRRGLAQLNFSRGSRLRAPR